MEGDTMPDTVIVPADSPSPRRSGVLWGVIGLLIVAGLGAWAWFATRPRPAIVTRRDIVGQIPLTGQILVPPSARADVPTPFRARVDRVAATVGERVRRGDVLVQLAVPDAQAYRDQTRAALRAAE